MREGLKLIKEPGYYGATKIGWLRRIQGDEYELVAGSWRTVWRTTGSRLLEDLAADGPLDDHELGNVAKVIDEINRHLVGSSKPANVAVWEAHCPRPNDWHL